MPRPRFGIRTSLLITPSLLINPSLLTPSFLTPLRVILSGASGASLPTSFLLHPSLGTYLLLLAKLLPGMLQDMLIAHGVGLKVTAFSGHHIAAQGEEAGFKVLPLESDLKGEWRVSQQLHRGPLASHVLPTAPPRPQASHVKQGLIDAFSFPLNTKPLISSASLGSALSLCRAGGQRRNGGWPRVSTINGYKPEQQTIRDLLDLLLLSKKINKMAGFGLGPETSLSSVVKYGDKARAASRSEFTV